MQQDRFLEYGELREHYYGTSYSSVKKVQEDLHTQSQDEKISIHTYTNEFGVTTVRIHYGPIRFIITSTLQPVVHQRMNDDNKSITVTLYFQQTLTKLYFRFQATEHRWTNISGTITVMIDYWQTGMHWWVYFSSLATSHTHQQCPLLVSKEAPCSIPVPESEWGRRNRKRSELVLDWRPPPYEVYGALLSGVP